MSKNLYTVSGCNGAGKTTASFTILPEILNCKEFVNADEIAKGLSPFQPEKVAFEAGRIMLHRINELLDTNTIFAFETTLATKSYKSKVALAQKKGYKVILLFFWLQDVELAIERVKTRVTEGGHNIETAVIKRRYINGILNLFNIYLPIADEVMIFDNSFGKPELLAEKMLESEIDIINEIKYDKLKGIYNENI
ncbi:zeta toxin [Flavobacterium sp. WLB]|uniref:zeta toxin family protein n=1 Tax=unclassified Flavobacterium TaxID=196869 RepID=UPI0006ABC194|nr:MULTISPECIES: zeta toxin family protein [unclassified Flavobacterium]KOP37191.1 zeta toxin [Flavobacterium sp. VMW]OWU90878.1 zeta toxin [Flavobacterium sp. NLM]PUU70846.1 zeta toxin [Flavobacterium sp. WLB]